MSGDTNVRLLREAYDEWNRSKGASVERWGALIGERFRLRSICSGKPGLDHARNAEGPEAAGDYLNRLMAEWTMDFFHVDEFIADGDRVVMLGRMCFTHKGTGRQCETRKVDIFTFEEGKIVDFEELHDSHAMMQAAGTA